MVYYTHRYITGATGIHHVTFSICVVQFSMFHNKKLIYGNCTNMVVSWGGEGEI